MSSEDAAAGRADADTLAAQLEAINRVLRTAAWEHARRLPEPLTAPQLEALKVLVEHMRCSPTGLSVTELTSRLGLAHSTVSGIIDRLEARGFVRRRPDPQDRRRVQIELSPSVRGWVTRELPGSRADRLGQALAKATPEQRSAIITGVGALARLIAEGNP